MREKRNKKPRKTYRMYVSKSRLFVQDEEEEIKLEINVLKRVSVLNIAP